MEYSSQLYVCFLDCRQAFDRVWTQGMFNKLLDNNIDDTSFIAITEMYKNVTSSVRYKGLISESFPIQQGTRQGGKSSPLLYLLYINDLIKELESSRLGMCMYNVDLCSPTVAAMTWSWYIFPNLL